MRTLLFVLACLPAAPAQSGPCTAEGVVLREGDGAPVARAKLLFRRFNGGLAPVTLGFFSGDDGRFRAFGLDAATYEVSVQKAGMLAPPSSRSARSPARLDLASCSATGLTYLLVPAAVIAGRVTDHLGQPLLGARVEAQKRYWMNGRWLYRAVSTAHIDRSGDFRISRLPAGSYVLRAYPSGPMTVSFRDPAGPTNYLAPAFFPGVYEASKAQIVIIGAGEELGGYDFGPMLVPFFKVEGRVLSGEGQAPPSRCAVYMKPQDPNDTFQYEARYTPESGAFAFTDIPPGRYRLIAYAAESANIGSAMQELDIAESHATGLALQLTPPITIRGRATLQGGGLPANAIWVNLRPLAAQAASDGSRWVDEQGNFQFNVVQHDRYRVSLESSQPNIYLKAVSLDGIQLEGTLADWSITGARDLGLLLANDGGRVEGVIEGIRSVQERAFVVLAPADASRLSAELIIEQAAADGRFRAVGVPPGDYIAFAFAIPLGSMNDPSMLSDPSWVASYRGRGTQVRVEPNSAAIVTVPLSPAP
ncbi:MAG: carboxypeptidase regulatory-like domain-containing protein [Candidatus Solibacter usitatus]|nr:carboxypeptidase regulatory-like domain-containing protein [Candidatus Solibacter usitatus]